jgi:hypothetical protein
MAWLGRVDLFFRSAGCAVGNYKLPLSCRTTVRCLLLNPTPLHLLAHIYGIIC